MTDSQPFRLGRFFLGEFIAQGGMGRVWRAQAAGADEVAVKVLRPDASDRVHAVRAFRSEVRAVARLSHPGIVSVYDFGEVSRKDADASDGRIEPGSPYLVMELVGGPSLRGLEATLSTEVLRAMILETLEALAHTHARGIIHRDLKPSNVLLAPVDSTSRPHHVLGRVKLTDFGIAHAVDSVGESVPRQWAEGTPGYMAPEQRRNLWRDFGPWTDLFALGRMVENLLDRAGPAGERVKESLAPWLERMIDEDWSRRFACAADAAVGLRSLMLENLDEELEPVAQLITVEQPTLTTMVDSSPGLSLALEEARVRRLPSVPPMPTPVFTVPAEWRTIDARSSEPALPLWGLRLFGLRPLSLVARDGERDHLWAKLREVAESKRSSVVLLRGGGGVGKSCLARWLSQLANEAGAAHTLRAFFGERPHPSQGIGPMLARFFRCSGLGREHTLSRLEPALRDIGLSDPSDWLVLTELIAAEDRGQSRSSRATTRGREEGRIRFGSERERNRALLRFFGKLARGRPVIVWLDDLQWSRAALAMLETLDEEQPGAMLFVATVQDEAAAASPLIEAELEALASRSMVETVRIEPLAPPAHKRLVRSLLALEDSLAARVEELTDGNPLFAEQLVGDLIHRDVLESSRGRFKLRDGADLDLPDGLFSLWAERAEQVVESDGDRVALELAAALGGEVDEDEWSELCAAAGVELDPSLLDRLFGERLAEPAEDGRSWSFVHNLLRESIERRAREGGRLARYHELCADLIGRQADPLTEERVGRHLLAAGAADRAEPLLLSAARRRHLRGEFRDAHFLLAERESELAGAGIAESDPRRLDGWLVLARCCRTEGELDEAGVWAHKAIEVSQKHGLERSWCEALLVSVSVARLRGETDQAHEIITRARVLADRVGDPLLIGDCYRELAWIRQGRGDLEGAEHAFNRALAHLDECDEDDCDPLKSSCFNGLAHGAIQAGDLDRAHEILERALALHQRFGSLTHQAYTLGALGDVARARGRFDEAEHYQRQSFHVLSAVGYGHMAYPLMNIGLVELDRQRWSEARNWFERALDALQSQGDAPSAGIAHAMLTPCCAAAADWDAFDRHLDEAERRLAAGKLTDADIANPLRAAGELAQKAGEVARARAAYTLSLAQWTELGREDQIAELEALVGQLED